MASGKDDKFPTLLREFRKRLGLSQDQAGEKLGVTGDYISQIETGRKTASASLRLLLEEISRSPLHRLNAPTSKMSEAATAYGEIQWIPLLSWAQAGVATAFEEIPESWQERVAVVMGNKKAIAIQIRGDSMEPKYQNSDIAIVLMETPARNGDLVIANIKEEGFAFKILNLVGGDPNHIRLKSYNALYEPMDLRRDQLHWIYPVHSVTKIVRR